MGNLRTDRRKHPRTATALPLKISKKGLAVITEIRNISCSGVYCRVNEPLSLMSKVGVTLFLPLNRNSKTSTERIKCNGVVVRSEPTILQEADSAYQNIAIFFTDISRKNKNSIARYVLQSFKKNMS